MTFLEKAFLVVIGAIMGLVVVAVLTSAPDTRDTRSVQDEFTQCANFCARSSVRAWELDKQCECE